MCKMCKSTKLVLSLKLQEPYCLLQHMKKTQLNSSTFPTKVLLVNLSMNSPSSSNDCLVPLGASTAIFPGILTISKVLQQDLPDDFSHVRSSKQKTIVKFISYGSSASHSSCEGGGGALEILFTILTKNLFFNAILVPIVSCFFFIHCLCVLGRNTGYIWEGPCKGWQRIYRSTQVRLLGICLIPFRHLLARICIERRW
ncbi:hypothetical protein BVC80_1837g207 [Macleaya cordata]|uniref:Uncharacterized protein n=1 Tax=Macleaya cordata TaxID=56857 RepID=A0A200R3V5_MACCD|nr:hypothetical protein BVC80_1837g207 [Macleaya cordata]